MRFRRKCRLSKRLCFPFHLIQYPRQSFRLMQSLHPLFRLTLYRHSPFRLMYYRLMYYRLP